MNLIKKDKLDTIVQNNYTHTFEIQESGTYLIEIIASAKNWWQNFKNLKSFFNDDDLAVKIDNIEFPKLNGKKRLFDGEVAWNGNNLKGLSKTNIFLINLEKSTHSLNFLSDKNPILESIAVYKIDETEINYIPEKNNPAQDGNWRQWMAIIPVNISIKKLNITASARNYPEKKDDDDIKIIVDGNIQKNEAEKSHKNWFWCGRILNGQEKEFSKELNFESGVHYIELWADGMPDIINLIILLEKDDKNQEDERLRKWKELKQYSYEGLNGKENYNRYDAQIIKAVAFWNKEFFSQDCPPNEALDPNLIKAMIFQESRVGYDEKNNGSINVMQVGNSGDPSLKVLNNQTENPENEMINGKLRKVDYEGMAKVENIYDSIYWGVRWLYHRAQYIGNDGVRHWFSWKDAVNRYGPGTQEYMNNIWNIYAQGLDKRVDPSIKLWTILFLLLIPVAVFAFIDNAPNNKSIKTAIFNTIENSYEKEYVQNIQVDYYKKNSPLFLTIIETQKDWSERFEIGNYINGKISWIEIDKMPAEQSILSARFLNLKGFDNPLVEVYGQTHAGHGSFYLYEIKNGKAKLLLKNPAVDINSDTRWTPDNKEKYGYENCGEVFFGGKLESDYEDLNGDGISDIILSGKEEIICDSHEINGEKYTEIKVAENPVKKVFLWDENAKSFMPK